MTKLLGYGCGVFHYQNILSFLKSNTQLLLSLILIILNFCRSCFLKKNGHIKIKLIINHLKIRHAIQVKFLFNKIKKLYFLSPIYYKLNFHLSTSKMR